MLTLPVGAVVADAKCCQDDGGDGGDGGVATGGTAVGCERTATTAVRRHSRRAISAVERHAQNEWLQEQDATEGKKGTRPLAKRPGPVGSAREAAESVVAVSDVA